MCGVSYLADEFLEDVFERHHSEDGSGVIDDPSHVGATALHSGQGVGEQVVGSHSRQRTDSRVGHHSPMVIWIGLQDVFDVQVADELASRVRHREA